MKEIPIWEKSNLSLEEAAAYSGIGVNKLRDITNDENCRFVLWVGNKRLIKRRLFDQYIDRRIPFDVPGTSQLLAVRSRAVTRTSGNVMCLSESKLSADNTVTTRPGL